MEKSKEGAGKTVIIIILALALIGLGGYTTYDKMNENSKTSNLEKEVEKLNNEIVTLKNEKQTNEINNLKKEEENTNAETNNFINAVYYGHREDTTNHIDEKEFLTLFSDGTFTDLYVDGGGSRGTYEINGNQLILHRPDSEGPSTGDTTCEISQDRTKVTINDMTLTNYK